MIRRTSSPPPLRLPGQPLVAARSSSTCSLEGGNGPSCGSMRLRRRSSTSELVAELCWLRALPLATACVILLFAGVEVAQVGLEVGHSHGLSLLALVRGGRALSELQVEAKEVFETLADRMHPAVHRLIGAAFGHTASLVACALAACSSLLECLRDARFGGHHGLAILSLADAVHMLRGMERWRGSVLIFGPVLSLSLAVCAAFCAVAELAEDLRPGSHHGVAILAIAHFAENFERARRGHSGTGKAV
mmetsp:Transcript_72568/g.224344  ORF Transcript_72568/g.224344 Transcript_72568/m.224344 type:complete len:248 (-) Transcript_72568:294-1037(-)|eukprot:CAMPEP_0204563382 /NCGR_PEP_ID=MMETSP0661-20131031/34277_1 /ASSEMBLY_ACC=CAM_ASM_000606 /TAXON_ID=109239 /ORGANISM="Alexandrium margalefi, Strain AMGDE01CS-322" /LENGTH=247 /DNA_ID=CAMNT_0051570931 /DNA_START=67 /DNA_END=810 /DNA_ORIENTATION=-